MLKSIFAKGVSNGQVLGTAMIPPGYPGGAGGPGGTSAPAPFAGWEVVVFKAPQYYQVLARIPQRMWTSLTFTKMLDDQGSGTLVLNLDDPWWQNVLPDGSPGHFLLDAEHLFQVWQDGVPRFDFLGETITEQLTDPSEQRLVTITGPGTIATLSWALAMPPGFPSNIVYKTDALTDSFSEINVSGNYQLDTGLWNASSAGGLSINPAGSVQIVGMGGGTILGSTLWNAEDSLLSAQVSPIVSPDANNVTLNGSQLTQMFLEDNTGTGFYVLMGLSSNSFYAQYNGPDGLQTQVIASATAYSTVQSNNGTYSYWQISEANGTFFFWTSADGQTWHQVFKHVRSWDASQVGVYFATVYTGATTEFATVTAINSNVVTSSLGGATYMNEPIMGIYLDTLQAAQARNTIPFVSPDFSDTGDSFLNPWTDSESVQVQNGTDLYQLLQGCTSMINADYIMEPNFRLRVGIPPAITAQYKNDFERIGISDQYDALVSSEAPSAWWPLSDGPLSGIAGDEAGQNNHGVATAVVFGNTSEAVSPNTTAYFNGSAKIVTPYNPGGYSSFTVDCWYNPLGAISSGVTDLVANSHPSTDHNGFQLIISAAGNPQIYFGNGSTSGNVSSATSVSGTSQWYYIAATITGGTITLYVNGVSQGTASLSGTVPTGSGSGIYIGLNPTTASTNIVGLMSEVTVTTGSALTATQVAGRFSAAAGNAITTANSGGTGETAFTNVSLTPPAAVTVDSTHSAHGSWAALFNTSASAENVTLQWTQLGTGSQFVRGYYYIPANPGAKATLIEFTDVTGTHVCGRVNLNTTGTLTVDSNTATNIVTTTNTVPLGAWFRLEAYCTGSATGGQLYIALYDAMDSGTATEVKATNGTLNTFGEVSQVWLGVANTGVTSFSYWLDDVAISVGELIGPVQAGTRPGRLAGSLSNGGNVTLGFDRSATVRFFDAGGMTMRQRVRARNQLTNLIAAINSDGRTVTAADGVSATMWGQREAWIQAAAQVSESDISFVADSAALQAADELITWTFQITPNLAGRTVFKDFAVGDWIGMERPDYSATDAVRVTGVSVSVDSSGFETHELILVSYVNWLEQQLTYLTTKLGGGFLSAAGTTAIPDNAKGSTLQSPNVFNIPLPSIGVAGQTLGAPVVFNPATGSMVPAGGTDPLSGQTVGMTVPGVGGQATLTGDGLTFATAVPNNIILNPNPDATNSTTGWNGVNATLTVTGSPSSGCPYPNAFIITPTANGSGVFQATATPYPPVTPSTSYIFFAWVNLPTQADMTIFQQVTWYDYTGSVISSNSVTSPVIASSWTQLGFQVSAPSNAVGALLEIGPNTASTSNPMQTVDVKLVQNPNNTSADVSFVFDINGERYYNGNPAANTLSASIGHNAYKDSFGNVVLPGSVSYFDDGTHTITAVQIWDSRVVWYAVNGSDMTSGWTPTTEFVGPHSNSLQNNALYGNVGSSWLLDNNTMDVSMFADANSITIGSDSGAQTNITLYHGQNQGGGPTAQFQCSSKGTPQFECSGDTNVYGMCGTNGYHLINQTISGTGATNVNSASWLLANGMLYRLSGWLIYTGNQASGAIEFNWTTSTSIGTANEGYMSFNFGAANHFIMGSAMQGNAADTPTLTGNHEILHIDVGMATSAAATLNLTAKMTTSGPSAVLNGFALFLQPY